MSGAKVYCGSRPADANDLQALAMVNYGHFTSMRVRGGAVQGLDLHLDRLRLGHAELFDANLDEAQLRHDLRAALAGWDAASVRITAFARDFNFRDPLKSVQPEWLISVSVLAPVATAPISVKSFSFVRPLPQVKHVGTLPLFHYRRQAQLAGCDDALLVDGTGVDAVVLEGALWNIGFWDGSQVSWPQGPALRGTCEALLQRGLAKIGVSQRYAVVSLTQAKTLSAFSVNANSCAVVEAIDGVRLPKAISGAGLLEQALQAEAWDPI